IENISAECGDSQSLGPGLHRHHVQCGSMADENARCIRHPPCATGRDLVSANISMHPSECFWIDWLADRVHDSNSTCVVFADPFFAILHEATYCGWGGVENVYAVSL